MPIQPFGQADPIYDALRVQSNQATWPDAGGGSGSTGGTGLENKITLWPADASTISTYDATEAGLTAALAAAAGITRSTVWQPSIPITITTSITVPANTTLRGISDGAIISPAANVSVILSDGCTLERVIINQAANSAVDMVAVQGPTTGSAYIVQSSITSTQAGAGDAIAISGGAGAVYAHDSYIKGTSTSGAGYSAQTGDGVITFDDCWLVFSTLPFLGVGTVTAYVAGDEISTGSITVNSGAGDIISGLTVSNWYAVECIGGPFNANPAVPKDSYHYSVSDDGGATWDGLLGADGTVMHLDAPAWGVNPVDLDGNHARFFFQATGTSILIRTGDFYWADNTGTLGWRLRDATLETTGVINVLTHACRMSTIDGEPVLGDRSVWDALHYQARHANDINDPDGIHHTLDALIETLGSGGGSGLAGWLDPWLYRIPITVANSDGTYTNKKVPIDVNTLPLVEASLCNSDLSDLRVTAADGVSLLPFFRANDALLYNESNFSRYASNPIITSEAGAAWDHGWIHPHSVIDMGDGTYRMYYGGNPAPGDSNTPNNVGYATSSDGIAWTKYGSNPIFSPGTAGQWDDLRVEHFTVIRVNATTWKAWYSGEHTHPDFDIGYATSSDGVTWTKYGSNPVLARGAGGAWDSLFVIPSTVWIEGSTYYMIYWGGTSALDDTTWKFGLATSSDGITWTKSASNPVFSGASAGAWDSGLLDCDVKKIGDTYFMFYQGNAAGQGSHIGIATSADLISWLRSPDNPFPHGAGGTWDSDWNEGPTLIRIGAKWMMYYMGKDASTTKSIGLMEFPDTRLWPIIPTLTSAGTTLFVYYGNPTAADVSTGSAGSPDANVTVTDGVQASAEFAAWDDETQPGAHARDIDDATYTYHTPSGGDNTKFLRGDRTWAVPSTPTLALNDLTDVDTSGEATGDVIYDNAGTWQVYPLGIGSKITTDGTKIRFGNVAGGSYLEIDTSTGNLRLVGNATTYDDFRVEASIVKAGATAPSYKAFGPSGNLQALMFEAGHHDEAMFELQMPHNWKEGSNIYPHVHWAPTTADAGNVVWELEYSWSNIGGTFGAPSNMATDPTAAGGTAWAHKLTYLKSGGNNYIDATGKTISSMLVCRIHRNSNSGSDTLNKDVALLEVDFHYQIDGFGSDEELVKDTSASLLLESGDILLLESGDKLLLE